MRFSVLLRQIPTTSLDWTPSSVSFRATEFERASQASKVRVLSFTSKAGANRPSAAWRLNKATIECLRLPRGQICQQRTIGSCNFPQRPN
jgi:hypothetical protein